MVQGFRRVTQGIEERKVSNLGSGVQEDKGYRRERLVFLVQEFSIVSETLEK